MHIKAYSISRVQLEGDKSAKLKDGYTRISSCLSRGNLNSIARMGKWGVLAFARLHPRFGGGGGESSVQESKIATLGTSLCAGPKMSSSWGRELTLTRTF